jgi:hypothetical protein
LVNWGQAKTTLYDGNSETLRGTQAGILGDEIEEIGEYSIDSTPNTKIRNLAVASLRKISRSQHHRRGEYLARNKRWQP